jgi:hypothetical protein
MNIKRYLLPLLLAGLLPTTSQVVVSDEHEVKFYDVEVIIFKNERGPKSHEYILPVSSPRLDDEMLDLSSALSIEVAREKSWDIIPDAELRLTQEVISIVNSPRYSLLAHAGWRQPGLDKDEAISVWIKGGRLYGDEYISIDNQIDLESKIEKEFLAAEAAAESGELDQSATDLMAAEQAELDDTVVDNTSGLYEFEGKITIVLARYLHTFADLVLRKPRLSIEDPALKQIDVNQLAEDIQSDTRILNNHSLKERRRMRSGKLHYLDSPEFSMLVLITPYELPDEAPVDPLLEDVYQDDPTPEEETQQ